MNDERQELFNKLLNLHTRLVESKRNKKNVMQEYKDEIKDIEDEIDEIVKELKE